MRNFILLCAVGASLVCAPGLMRGNQVAAWGYNSEGETNVPPDLGSVKAVAAGYYHNLALRPDGTVAAWGYNYQGPCNVPAGLSNVVGVAAGDIFSMALRADGRVVAWGHNLWGQTNVPPELANVVAIAAGGNHALALRQDGTVSAWGYNALGQTNVPANLSSVIAIAAGDGHSLALKADGTVVAWGDNLLHQCEVPPGLSNVVAIAAGWLHSLALKADGTVVAWGDNTYGKCNIPAGLTGVKSVAAGWGHSLALRADGSVVAWGNNDYGAQSTVPTWLGNAQAISAGGFHNLAVVAGLPARITRGPADQTLLAGGTARFEIDVAGSEPFTYQWYFNGTGLADGPRISGANSRALVISEVTEQDAGEYSVAVWNAFGWQLSSNAVLRVVSPPYFTQQPWSQGARAGANVQFQAVVHGTQPLTCQWLFNGQPVAGIETNQMQLLLLTNVQQANAGSYWLVASNPWGVGSSDVATLTVTDSPPYLVRGPAAQNVPPGGTASFSVWAKGSLPLSYQWQFNGADIPGATNPELVLNGVTFAQAGYYHAVASNPFGEVSSPKARLSVLQSWFWGPGVGGAISNAPPGLTNLAAIAVGDYHVLALKRDGSVATWATSIFTARSLTNVPPTVTNVVAIAAGPSCSLALRSDGRVIGWGDNSSQQTNVPSTLTNAVAIVAGLDHCLAIRSDGTVAGWGRNQVGQATPPAGLSNVISIAGGAGFSLAATGDGRVTAWGGNNSYGELNVPAGLSNVIAVAATAFNGFALKSDGTVVAWGSTTIPPGTNVPRSLSDVASLAVGYYAQIALLSDGTLKGWGTRPTNSWPALSNVFAIAVSLGGGGYPDYSVALVGDGAPRFAIEPMNQIVQSGTRVAFHARAVGAAPMTYQWLYNGHELAGATEASFTLASGQGKDGGSYSVRASNPLGTQTSRVATLTLPNAATFAEAVNATNLVWEPWFTNAPWFAENRVTHDGYAAGQSGAISHNERSLVQTTVVGPGTLKFWWKVSSEEYFDTLGFYVDVYSAPRAMISGEVDWEQRSFAIPSGMHRIWWNYSKDASVSYGEDAAWLDEVSFTPDGPVVLQSATLLEDGGFRVQAQAAGGDSFSAEDLARFEAQASTNLIDWEPLPEALTWSNGALILRDHASTNYQARFYRIIPQ